MKSYQIAKDLLDQLEQYERQNPQNVSIKGFTRWMMQTQEIIPKESEAAFEMNPEEASMISQYVVLLQRYAKGYARKALAGTPIGSEDEFIYLIILMENGAMSKTALIQQNRHEKPTGMDIIRRLIAAGYIEQSDNPEDKRSKLLNISREGKAIVEKLYPRMQFVAELVAGNLTPGEASTLLSLLEKLEHYHQFIQAKTKGGDFADLLRAMKDG
jgi:DNA-binding MarR family transcriptional regulator